MTEAFIPTNVDCDLFVVFDNNEGVTDLILGAFPYLTTATDVARSYSESSPSFAYRVVGSDGTIYRAFRAGQRTDRR